MYIQLSELAFLQGELLLYMAVSLKVVWEELQKLQN
jgi:hypothetical protein